MLGSNLLNHKIIGEHLPLNRYNRGRNSSFGVGGRAGPNVPFYPLPHSHSPNSPNPPLTSTALLSSLLSDLSNLLSFLWQFLHTENLKNVGKWEKIFTFERLAILWSPQTWWKYFLVICTVLIYFHVVPPNLKQCECTVFFDVQIKQNLNKKTDVPIKEKVYPLLICLNIHMYIRLTFAIC